MKKLQVHLFKSSLHRRAAGMMILVLLVILLSSCSGTRRVTLPPVTERPTENYHFGKFVWFDLVTDDVPAAMNFYGSLFGWEFDGGQRKDPVFTLIKLNGKSIGGIVYHERTGEESEARWLSYVSVADVDETAKKIQSMGGTIYREPKDYNNRGRLAVVSDPQGAIFALINANGGDPDDIAEPINHFWLWNELLTQDPEAAVLRLKELDGN